MFLNQAIAGISHIMEYNLYTPNKPRKVCIVFGLSADHHGVSISKELSTRKSLTNHVLEVLLCSRQKQIAVTGNIEAVIHSVRIPEELESYM